MRRKLLIPLVLGGALSIGAIAPVAAQPIAVGPFGSLIGVIVQIDDTLNNVLNDSINHVVNVNINDSLNNVLQNAFQNADIDVLTGSLNNLLQNADIDVTITDITVVGDSVVVTVLGTTGVADTIVLS